MRKNLTRIIHKFNFFFKSEEKFTNNILNDLKTNLN